MGGTEAGVDGGMRRGDARIGRRQALSGKKRARAVREGRLMDDTGRGEIFVSGEHRDAWLATQRIGRFVASGGLDPSNRAIERKELARAWRAARETERLVQEALAAGAVGVAFTVRLPRALAAADPEVPRWALTVGIAKVKAAMRRVFDRMGIVRVFEHYAAQPSRDGLPHWHGTVFVPRGLALVAEAVIRDAAEGVVDRALGAGEGQRLEVFRSSKDVVRRSGEVGRHRVNGWVWYVLRPYLTPRGIALAKGHRPRMDGGSGLMPTRVADVVTTRSWIWANAIGQAHNRSRRVRRPGRV